MGQDLDPQAGLEEGVRRLQAALGRMQRTHGPLVQDVVERTGALVRASLDEKLDRQAERRRRRAERRHRLEAGRSGSCAEGVVNLFAAAVLTGFAIFQPHLWWLVFPALGFASNGARLVGRAGQAPAGLPEAPPSLPAEATGARPTAGAKARQAVAAEGPDDPSSAAIDSRLARVDATCEKLLSELKSAPEGVRELIGRPEETVEALRTASHELARRESELRSAVRDEDGERLRRERSGLEARIAAERDDVVRGRLTEAIEALDSQLAERDGLSTLAARIEAEGMRLLYSLERLRAQLLRARAVGASAPVAGDDTLRDGLQQLSREMTSAATALEEVHATERGRRPVPLAQPTGR